VFTGICTMFFWRYFSVNIWEKLINAWTVPENLAKTRCLVLTNPISGGGAGKQIYEQVVKPMLEKACMIYAQIETKSREHVIEIGENLNADDYDAILIISGDGGFTTLLDGIAKGSDTIEDFFLKLQGFKFGLVPAGTSNSLATTLSYQWDGEKASSCPVDNMKRILQRISQGDSVVSDLYSVSPASESLNQNLKPSDIRWDFIGCHIGVIAEIDLSMEGDLRCIPKPIREILAPVMGIAMLPHFEITSKIKLGNTKEGDPWFKGTQKLQKMIQPDSEGWYDLGSRDYNVFTLVKTEFLDKDMHIAPKMTQGDGRLALLSLPIISRWQALNWFLGMIGGGTHVDYDIDFLNIPVTEVQLSTNGRLDVAGDHYEKCDGREIHIKLHESKLMVL